MRTDLQALTVTATDSIRTTMRAIDQGGFEIALACEGDRLVGVVTDGDIRRALLDGATLEDPIGEHLRRDFIAVRPDASTSAVLELMRTRGIEQVPIVSAEGVLSGMHVLSELIEVRIPLSVPVIGASAMDYLRECVETNFVSTVGPFVSRFEDEFGKVVGARAAVACASGTAAIHLALLALGVGPGDEVWVSDLTFVASANPARYCGADVVLVDSERSSWNLDPALVVGELERRAAAGERLPAAIVVVHLLGHPADLAPIVAAAERHGVPIVEDAAEALGAAWTDGPLAGRQVGTVGAIGCYSFNGNKLITTGGGGMVVASDEQLTAACRHLSTQAKLPGLDYRHDTIGFNYRLTNLGAALGVSQLEILPDLLQRRREIADRYDAAFRSIPSIELPPSAPWARRSAWLYSPLFADHDERERVRSALSSRQVEARAIWVPVHEQEPYAGTPVLGTGAIASDIAERALSLPCSPSITDNEQDRVIDLVLATVDDG